MQQTLRKGKNVNLQLGNVYAASVYNKLGLRVAQCLLSAVDGETLVGQYALIITFPARIALTDAGGDEKKYDCTALDLVGIVNAIEADEQNNENSVLTVLRAAGAHIVDGALCVVVPWTEFISADWDGHSNSLLLRFVDGNRGPWQLYLPISKQADNCAQIIRERIQSSLVHSAKAQLDSGATVWAAVRRGQNGLFTQLLADGQVPNTPAVEAILREIENSVKDAVGI